MALEAVVFSQDPSTSYTYCSKDFNFAMNYHDFSSFSSKLLFQENYDNVGMFDKVNSYELLNTNNNFTNEEIRNDDASLWDHQQQQYVYRGYSSQEEYFSGEAPPCVVAPPMENTVDGRTRRKRRRRTGKNKEEVEQQRMTHIAVERNRRKQMNEYLAVIRSLMPPSYVQRGDQASIVGGAINYVKELEQMLQSMEAQKGNKIPHEEHEQNLPCQDSLHDVLDEHEHNETNVENVAANFETNESAATQPVFAEFFSFPQYTTRSNEQPTGSDSVSRNSAAGEIEVTMVDSHANVKILVKKQPKQLLKLVAAFQGLRLCVLHLNVSTVDSFVLYSLSLKVEEGGQLNSADDIAAAANHILSQIQQEAAVFL